MLVGADSIDDCELLRAGRTRRLLGGFMPAPSTLGTFLRAFTFGHVRQLDRLLGEALTRAWRAGAGPGSERLVVDVDSFIGEVHGYRKQGASFGYTKRRGYQVGYANSVHAAAVLLDESAESVSALDEGCRRVRDLQLPSQRIGRLEIK
jgi:hypothetical protein